MKHIARVAALVAATMLGAGFVSAKPAPSRGELPNFGNPQGAYNSGTHMGIVKAAEAVCVGDVRRLGITEAAALGFRVIRDAQPAMFDKGMKYGQRHFTAGASENGIPAACYAAYMLYGPSGKVVPDIIEWQDVEEKGEK